jgi:putative transposase
MRYRDYKIFRSGHYYHIYNRGVNKQEIFLDVQDYHNFLKRLFLVLGIKTKVTLEKSRISALPEDAFSMLAYCLMPNHFHLLIRQNTDLGIDKFMLKISTSYAIYFNKKYGRVGPLYQDSFKAKLVEQDSYLTYLSAYIHNNPEEPFTWEFFSFRDYLGIQKGGLCQTDLILGMFSDDPQRYKKFVQGFDEKGQLKIIDLVFEED